MKRYHFTIISSTNDYAKQLLEQENQVVITADSQMKGRGRKERNWEGDFGTNIYLSYGINHQNSPEYQSIILFQAVGCLAVIDSLELITKATIFKLKYPNDVFAFQENSYKKISGVLIEHSFMGNLCKSTIIGIGVNVNQTNFSSDVSEIATSLKLLGFDIKTENLYNLLIEKINYYLHLDTMKLYELWKERLNITNKIISLSGSTNQWIATEFMNDGRIKLINELNQERIVDDGDTIRYKLD